MARAALKSQARGLRVHSTGAHATRRKFDVAPTLEYAGTDYRDAHPVVSDEDSNFASFERMMRGNRGVL